MKRLVKALLIIALTVPACGDHGSGPATLPYLNYIPVQTEYSNGHPLAVEDPGSEEWRVDELTVFELVNNYRTSQGKNVLIWDQSVIRVARGHAKHMHDHNFVSHINPEGDDPAGRWALVYGFPGSPGENAAYHFDPASTVNAWITSLTHRANILSDAFWTGVGIWGPSTPGSQRYYCQLFAR